LAQVVIADRFSGGPTAKLFAFEHPHHFPLSLSDREVENSNGDLAKSSAARALCARLLIVGFGKRLTQYDLAVRLDDGQLQRTRPERTAASEAAWQQPLPFPVIPSQKFRSLNLPFGHF
jgi:hypothetical protein